MAADFLRDHDEMKRAIRAGDWVAAYFAHCYAAQSGGRAYGLAWEARYVRRWGRIIGNMKGFSETALAVWGMA